MGRSLCRSKGLRTAYLAHLIKGKNMRFNSIGEFSENIYNACLSKDKRKAKRAIRLFWQHLVVRHSGKPIGYKLQAKHLRKAWQMHKQYWN